ncbi:hypothetical protein ACWGE0_42600 [Lentzea sp. NPDC054927]
MSKTSSRLLAACAAATALLATTSPAAGAATAPEATAAAYVFVDEAATTSESLIAENADLTAPFLASGHTDAHKAWDIRLSDEAYGPNLPTQPFVAKASHTDTQAGASTAGFISLTDRHPRDLPFMVLKMGSRNVSCLADGPVFTGGGGSPQLWWRGQNELLPGSFDGDNITSAMPVHFPGSVRVPTTVRVTPVSATSDLAAYPPLAKYAGRTKAGVIGYEIKIVQRGEDVYRILVAAAASC